MYYSTLRGLGNAAERYGRAGWLRLYNRLESGDSVYAADVTLDFTSYLMRTYGIRSTAFRRAREILSLRAKGMVPTPGNPIRLSMGNLVARPEPVVEAGLDVPTFAEVALAEISEGEPSAEAAV